MYANVENKNVVAIEFSRRREQEPSASRTFVRLNVLDYKKQSRRNSIRIQSALCEVACFKIFVASRIASSCVRRISNKQLLLYKSKTVGHKNSVYNKDKDKLNTYLFLVCSQLTNS